jgi:hypothetical protein
MKDMENKNSEVKSALPLKYSVNGVGKFTLTLVLEQSPISC